MKKILKNMLQFIIDKLKLFKIILFDYFLLKNWFINSVVLSIIYLCFYFNKMLIIGPLLGALSTFNLINGYTYYSKYRHWNQTKNIILGKLNEFLIEYNIYLQCHRFPIDHKRSREHYDLDNLRDKDFHSLVLHEDAERKKILNSIYNRYENFLTELKSDTVNFKIDDQKLEQTINFLRGSVEKINQNTILAMVSFGENSKLIKEIIYMTNRLQNIIDYYGFNIYKDDIQAFLDDTLSLIKQVNKLVHLL